jgi:hypothetical protein
MDIVELSKKIAAEIENEGEMSDKLLKKLHRATTGKWKAVRITEQERKEIYKHNSWDEDYRGYFMFSGRQVVISQDSGKYFISAL